MSKTLTAGAAFLLFSGCQKTPEQLEPTNQQNAPVAPAPSIRTNQVAPAPLPAPSPPEPGTSGGLPDDRTPLPEPKGPIDPKSAEAAGQVVQHFGALIEQKRFAEAEKLWGHAATANKETAELKRYSEAHLQIGKPTDMEGAAGSVYITVPVVLYGTLDGKTVHRSGNVILRRVNDVPGSTEAQRRWHIERIEWSGA
jgi:hypothetical protein